MTTETEGAAQEAVQAAAIAESEALLRPEPEKAPEDTPQTVEAGEDTTTPGDDAAATEAVTAEKPKKTAQERIDEITSARREAEREAEYWKAKALQTGEPKAELKEPAQAASQDEGKPSPDDFQDGVYDPSYVEAMVEWKAEQIAQRTVAEHSKRNREAENARSVYQSFESRAKEHFPEGEPDGLKAFRSIPADQMLPVPLQDLIAKSDLGPVMADHLGANPSEIRRIKGLSPFEAAAEIGRLESRLSPPAKAAEPAPTKIATDAPAPASQVRGQGGRFKVAPDTNDFREFDKTYG